MLASYSIRTKIIAVVAFLLVAMTGMGLLAVRNMRAINANTVDISTSWLPSVRVLGDLRAGVITYRNVIREHMLSETLEEKLAMEKTLATVIEANTKYRATYEPMITSPEEQALYAEWSKLWDKYKAGTQEVMALSRKAVGKIPTEAHDLNTKVVNKIGLEADAVLNKDIELNKKGADKAAQDAADSYASALLMLAMILAAAVILGASVSIYLVRDVSGGIASIVKPMQALGKGDLSADVAAPGREDRNRRDGRYPAGVQAGADRQEGRRRGRRRRCRSQDRARPPGRRHHPQFRIHDRRDRPDRIVGIDPARSLGQHAVCDRQPRPGGHQHGRLGFRGGDHQRAVGGVSHGRALLLGHRDQPPGAGIGADGVGCGRSGPHHQRSGQRIVESRRPHRRRGRTDQHHRRPDQSAGAQRDHRGGAGR
jgi:hypothetical protein